MTVSNVKQTLGKNNGNIQQILRTLLHSSLNPLEL